MHSRNIHRTPYDLDALAGSHKPLDAFVFTNEYGTKTINFSDPKAVLHLNKALLKHHYGILEWEIPENYLCPPIPGRADYIHHLKDLIGQDEEIKTDKVKGLDIGMGANCIFPILGARIYNWEMTGADVDLPAVHSALNIKNLNPGLEEYINIRHQEDRSNVFKGIVKEGEFYHFSMCNPPFHASEEAARKANVQKTGNLGSASILNFGGQANELWCNGGEALFVKRMIKESVNFKTQIRWFTSLVSQKPNLPKLIKQIEKLKASHKIIEMESGNKKSRILAWRW